MQKASAWFILYGRCMADEADAWFTPTYEANNLSLYKTKCQLCGTTLTIYSPNGWACRHYTLVTLDTTHLSDLLHVTSFVEHAEHRNSKCQLLWQRLTTYGNKQTKRNVTREHNSTSYVSVWLITQSDPIVPNRTPPDPVGPIRTQHRTSSRQPQDSHSLTRVHLANTFDNRYTRKVTNLNTIETNHLQSLLAARIKRMRRLRRAPTYSEQLWTETTSIECT